MSKENRNLIINASILLLVGIVFLVSMFQYNKAKDLKVYKEYFSEASSFKKEKLEEGPITEVITVFKGKDEIGFIYTGLDYAEDIYGHDKWSLLKLQVLVDGNKKIVEVNVLEHEHTPEYFAKVEEYLPTLKGTYLSKYKEVDEVSGASQFSMPIVRDILDTITKLQTGSEPLPAPEKDPYLSIFDNYKEAVEDTTFTKTEEVIKKEIVKDNDGNVLGYGYYLNGITDEYLHPQYKKEYGELTLLVVLDENDKVVGIKTIESGHTGNYYDKYEVEYEKLVGKVLDGNVDIISESTVSGNLIVELIEALKGVLE